MVYFVWPNDYQNQNNVMLINGRTIRQLYGSDRWASRGRRAAQVSYASVLAIPGVN